MENSALALSNSEKNCLQPPCKTFLANSATEHARAFPFRRDVEEFIKQARADLPRVLAVAWSL